MPSVHIDYETFSEVDLRSAGVHAYARHKSTRVLCLAWAIDNGPVSAWWPALGAIPQQLVRVFKTMQIHAFNANFERLITEHVGVRYGFPAVLHSQWVDTQAIARMLALPDSLEKCSAALNLPINKDKDGARLINLFSKPQRDGSVVLPASRPEEFRKMVEYCKRDVKVDRAVAAALPLKSLPGLEQRVWEVDGRINGRGVRVDVAMAKGADSMRAVARKMACDKLPAMTNGMVGTVGQAKRILAFASAQGFPLPNLKKETLLPLLESDSEMPQALRDVLELRASTNLTSVAKYSAMMRAVEPDGRIRGVHAYHRATTGRWGGRIVQFQNLPRPSAKLEDVDHQLIRDRDVSTLSMLYGNLMPVLRDALRNTIRASPGKSLVVVDKASIEARVLGYLSGCKGYLKAYRQKLDLYILTAALVFNKTYDQIVTLGLGSFERWLGKTIVLGLGYSMGEATFWESCRKNGRILEHTLTKRAVDVYRSNYPEIPSYWRVCEQACLRAIRTRQPTSLPHGIVVNMVGHYLAIQLPSGRCLWYPHAKIVQKTNKYGKLQDNIRFHTTISGNYWGPFGSTYGGRIVENIVQAVARDLLAEALIKCEDRGLEPVLHIHDEVVCDTDAKNIDKIHEIFRTPPTWAPDLLLGSGGFVSPFYKK